MYPPCLVFTERVLPELRIRVAHHLNASGFTQTEISRHLHVSQAMVSKYLSAPQPPSDLDDISSEIAHMIIQKKDEKDILLHLCQTCFLWREGGTTCRLHNLRDCTVCSRLRSPEITDEKQRVIQNIKDALLVLESSPSVVKVMPEVRMNVAMALKGASHPMEVAAVPGRIVPVHRKVRAVSDPEFGASHHLASILINTGNTAAINIKYTAEIHASFEALGFSLSHSLNECADVLIDEGGFGIEPSAYIFGRDAVDAALKCLKVAESL